MSLKDEKLNFIAWESILTGITRFVTVAQYRGIRFEIRPKERGHNEPHCHVSYQGCEVSVSLIDYDILDGNIPPKQLKLASQWVKNNIDVLKKYWDEYHDEIVA
jgi:hypothetical protein